MIIYSWNMLFRNRELDRAFEFISSTDFDIFCLQEVPEAFLARLRALPYHLAESVDADRLFRHVQRNHLVILSRGKIEKHGATTFPEYWPGLPWRAKLLVRLLRPLGWSKIANRSGLSADIATSSGIVRVFNLHLVLATPDRRLREFEMMMAERDPALPTIVCGDFNVVESPRVSLLNWLLGGSVSDVYRYGRERTHIEKRFALHELINPHRERVTHAFAGSQLDHILVSNSFTVQKAEVIKERYGSDHHPIRVDTA